MSDWQPIETAPRDRTAVHLFDPMLGRVWGWWDDATDDEGNPAAGYEPGWEVRGHDGDYIFGAEPTLWHPFPEPPEVT